MKYILSIILFAGSIFSVFSGNVDNIISQVLQQYSKAGGISASVNSVSSDGAVNGNVILQNEKFFLNTPGMKVWYNGENLWTYTSESGELMLTEPSIEDLYSISPYAALSNYKRLFTVSLLKDANSIQVLKLTPKSSDTVFSNIILTVNGKNKYIIKVEFYFSNGYVNTVNLNYTKSGQHFSSDMFKYNLKLLPAGTPVVDLR